MLSSGNVLIPTSRPHQRIVDLVSCGDTSDEVREELHAKCILKEDNVIESVQEDVQFPPSSFQQEREWNEALFETLHKLGDVVHGTVEL